MAIDIQGVAPLFQVFDMLASIRFYRDLLGFELVQTSKPLSEKPDDVNWAMLRLNGVTLMLNTAYEPEFRPQAPDPTRFEAMPTRHFTSDVRTLTKPTANSVRWGSM